MTVDARELAVVFVGGSIGTAARAELAELAVQDPGQWPWGTFTANIVAALLIGYFVTRFPPSGSRRPLLGAAFCGGLSTFATMQLELLGMLNAGHVALAVGYIAASVTVGFVAVALATNLTPHSGVAA